MSSNNPEPQDQQWPTYPGVPNGPGQPAAPKPGPDPAKPGPFGPAPYAESPAPDDSYRGYESYSQQPGTEHQRVTPYQSPMQRRQSSNSLNRKYLFIVVGIIAAVVITSVAQNGFSFWPFLLFIGLAWWIMNNRRRGTGC
jgi:hypothetical protein